MENRTMTFGLSKPLSYTKGGDKEETLEIELGAPSVAAFGPATRFGQSVTRAVLEMQGKMSASEVQEAALAARERQGSPAEDGDGLDANAVRVFLMASSEDLEKTFEAFKTLASKIGVIEEGVPLKAAHLDKMDYEDVLRMMCEYAANFTVPSLFAAETDGQ